MEGLLTIFFFFLIIYHSYEGVRLFTCEKPYGIFVKISDCVVGDFPELDLEEL
jgi:hypothetical protein